MLGRCVQLLVCVGLLVVPVASADPGYSVPDATPVGDAAEATADARGDDAVATHQGNVVSATRAVGKVQQLTFPESELIEILENSGGFGERSAGAGADLAAVVADNASRAASTKIEETTAVAVGVDHVGAAAVRVGSAIAFAALDAVCTHPLVDPDDPSDVPPCDAGSVGGETGPSAERIVDELEAALLGDSFGETREAAEDLVWGILVP